MNRLNMKKIKLYFFYLLLLPESVINFLSGIFISAAINILTSQIPQGILTVGEGYLIAAILMIFISVLLVVWAMCVKPLQQMYKDSVSLFRGGIGEKKYWYNILCEHNATKLLAALFCLTIILLLLCFLILIFPSKTNDILQSIMISLKVGEGI